MQGFLIHCHQLCCVILTDLKYHIDVDFSLMYCTKSMMPEVIQLLQSSNYSVADTMKLTKDEIKQLFKHWKQNNLIEAMLENDDVDYNMDKKIDNTKNSNDNDNDNDIDVEDDEDDDEDASMGVNSNDNNNVDDEVDSEILDPEVPSYNPHDDYYTKKETQEQMINYLKLLLKKTTELKEMIQQNLL